MTAKLAVPEPAKPPSPAEPSAKAHITTAAALAKFKQQPASYSRGPSGANEKGVMVADLGMAYCQVCAG